MKKLSFVKYVFLSFVTFTSTLYANEDQNAVENVIRWAYTSIARIEEGKIFLKPEKLHLNQGIIYVEDINGGVLAIPVVFSRDGYPYVQVSESTIFNLWKCQCNAWNHNWDNPRICRRCGEPR